MYQVIVGGPPSSPQAASNDADSVSAARAAGPRFDERTPASQGSVGLLTLDRRSGLHLIPYE
ncbi:hypothetical protein GCM10025331_83810 [Actinoplanes utahensis]|nr:hypothetical protein Aut01nite_67720 [Actinoplanes utahensis]